MVTGGVGGKCYVDAGHTARLRRQCVISVDGDHILGVGSEIRQGNTASINNKFLYTGVLAEKEPSTTMVARLQLRISWMCCTKKFKSQRNAFYLQILVATVLVIKTRPKLSRFPNCNVASSHYSVRP